MIEHEVTQPLSIKEKKLLEIIRREENLLKYTDRQTKYTCIITRSREEPVVSLIRLWCFHLCGYVVITNKKLIQYLKKNQDVLDVHGGVTFCDRSERHNQFLVGFDCAHLGDRFDFGFNHTHPGTYRDLPYVKKELRKLCKQIKKIEEEL